jgi:hypothetical protein
VWQRSISLLERVYKLASSLPVPDGQRLADALIRASAPIPGLLVQADPNAERALLEAEALVSLVVRLGYLSESHVAPTLRAIDELREAWTRAPVPAPAPSPATQTSPAPAAPPRRPAPVTPSASGPRKPAAVAPTAEPERLFVDGCNFLGCAPGYELGDPDSRDRLLFRLQEYAHEHPAHRVAVFFDGKRASSRVTSGVEERITSGIHSADDVILDHIRALPRPDRRRCTLVTDDRELAVRARNEGVRAESVQWLVSRFVQRRPAGNPRAGLNKSELSEWEQFFNEPPRRPGK